jgi:tetratricopeptide (TPR) repeat protein
VTADDDPQKPDFLNRLGGLYGDKRRYYATQARALAARTAVAPIVERPSLEAQRKQHESYAQKWLLEAVKAYIGATKYRSYERMDEVLFRLTELLGSVDKDQQAREFFLRLSRDYVTSKYVPAAEIVVADGWCRQGRSDEATAHYDNVARQSDAGLRAFAEYSRAWCELDLGHVTQALEGFVVAVRMSRDGGDARAQRLRNEAIKDLVRAYARTGGPERALGFFRQVDADAAPEMMRSLGAAYQVAGKPGEAARAAELAR